MTVNATRIEQIIRAARPLRFVNKRAQTLPAPMFIAAMVMIHKHEGERMALHRFADLMQISNASAWMVLSTLRHHGFIVQSFAQVERGPGRPIGCYHICEKTLQTAPEVIVPRRTRRAA